MVGVLRDDDARLIVIVNNIICEFRNREFIWKNIERCNMVLVSLTKIDGKEKYSESDFYTKKEQNTRKLCETRARRLRVDYVKMSPRMREKMKELTTKFQIHFRPLRSLQDRPRLSRPWPSIFFPCIVNFIRSGLSTPLVSSQPSREYFTKNEKSASHSWTILRLAFCRDKLFAKL